MDETPGAEPYGPVIHAQDDEDAGAGDGGAADWIRPGTLYVCATPIGNLGDVTLRLLALLRRADRVLAEDTRRTRQLLAAYGIRTRIVSCHEHNEATRSEQVIRWLADGEVVALLTDAGTPGVADPGARLVARVTAAGRPVVPLPGPSAALAAFSAAGIPATRILIEGFLPRDAERRRERMRGWRGWDGAVIVYEAPHRLRATLADLLELLPDAHLVVARELTKRYEEIRRGPVARLVPDLLEEEPRGEYTLVVAPTGLADGPGRGPSVADPRHRDALAPTEAGASRGPASPPAGVGLERQPTPMPPPEQLAGEVAAEVAAGTSPSAAARKVARRHGLRRSVVYRAFLDHGAPRGPSTAGTDSTPGEGKSGRGEAPSR
ncbi:MAG TPA: 16S rRNA (cytidine(1402)-2'-O)-methyltransferase [Thermaerobacter sp.]